MDEASKSKWQGRWDQLKGKAKQSWSNLTDDDRDVAESNYDEMVSRIKERTADSHSADAEYRRISGRSNLRPAERGPSRMTRWHRLRRSSKIQNGARAKPPRNAIPIRRSSS